MLCTLLLSLLRPRLRAISPAVLALPAHFAHPELPLPWPTAIIPLLTPHPRALSAHLRAAGLNARPIAWPTVAKGSERVRVCVHAGNTPDDIERLVSAVVEWAQLWEREHAVRAKL